MECGSGEQGHEGGKMVAAEGRRAKGWPPTGEKADSGKGYVDGCAGGLGFKEG